MGSGELPRRLSVRSAFSSGLVHQWSFEVSFSRGQSVALRAITTLSSWWRSRGLDGKALLQCQRWKSGSSFLWGPESEWPLQPNSHQVYYKDPELKKVVCLSARKEGNEILNRILSHFPNWFRLQRFVAWIHWTVKGLQRSLNKKVGRSSDNLLSYVH